MPIYEEKLISPLAIRFTQQRIRETFQDGYEVEATIKQITAAPGVGDYDVILEVPFPAIEIIRWAANGRSSGSGENWFSFDNRRLYCLQRVAAKYWPKRVGVSVEVLYADSGAIRKKLDTQTSGMSVSIGHAFSVAHELKEWTWRKAVQKRGLPSSRTRPAEAVIASDDAKTNVGELNDAPVLSSFERLERAEELKNNPIMPEEQVTSSEDESEKAQVTPEKSKANQGELRSTGETTPPQNNSLTDLIGQLLVLKISDDDKPKEHVSDDASSTHLSERTETADSSGSPSAASSDPTAVSGGEEEDSVQQEIVKEQPTAKKAAKDPLKSKAAKAAKAQRAALEAHAMQYQMAAQCQMAQLQQAQYMQAAQYAHWQHASFAAAQFQAAQHGYY